MDTEINTQTGATPYATADGPDISAGLSGPSNDAGKNVGGYYGFGSHVWNWLTGANTAREKQTEAANQIAMAKWNAAEAQKNRDFEERMSNTAITRAVADAERNGINKYYLLNGGLTASTPSGSTASASYEPLNASGARRSSVGSGLFQIVRTIVGAYLTYELGLAGAAFNAVSSVASHAAKTKITEEAKRRAAQYLVDTHGAPLG